MAEMIERLRNMVRSAGELNLLKFFERAQSRRELVVAFLSVLGTGAPGRNFFDSA